MIRREKRLKVCIDDDACLETRVGVLGDSVGTGKTRVVLGLIKETQGDPPDEGSIEAIEEVESFGLRTRLIKKRKGQFLNCTLVVANQSLLGHWEKEADKMGVTYDTLTSASHIRNVDWSDLDVEALFVSQSMYNKMVDYTEDLNLVWRRFVIDDPPNTHVNGMKFVSFYFFWCMSATWRAVSDRYLRGRHAYCHLMKDLVGYLEPEIIDKLVVRNEHYDMVTLPDYEEKEYRCSNPVLGAVRQEISGEIAEMLAGGDIKGAIERLGGSSTSEANVMDLVLMKVQDELKECRHKVSKYTGKKGKKGLLKEWTEKTETCSKRLEALKTRISEAKRGECPICHDPITDAILEPACQNIFCGKCAMAWFTGNSTCPLCRATVELSSLVHICEEKLGKEKGKSRKVTTQVQRPKPDTLLRILKGLDADRKTIIFSNHDASFEVIRRLLDDGGVPYLRMQGTKGKRENCLDMFRSGDVKILFLNSIINGAGLNLQCATDIIIYHRLEEDMKRQVIGRVQRIGKKDSFRVHYLLDDEDRQE